MALIDEAHFINLTIEVEGEFKKVEAFLEAIKVIGNKLDIKIRVKRNET